MTAEKPLVVFDYGFEMNRSRGDCNGVLGVARHVAHLLRADLKITSASEPITNYAPDVLFMPDKISRPYDLGKVTFSYGGINEALLKDYGDDQDMIFNSLTPEILAEQGAEFEKHYPGLPRPLIAVNIADIGGTVGSHLVASDLAHACLHYPQSTLFLTGCWRTAHIDFAEFSDEIVLALTDLKIGNRVKLVDFEIKNPNLKNAFNPYIGLLDRADHIVVFGTSLSMFTEPLAAGKTPYIVGRHSYSVTADRLMRRRLARDFNSAAASKPLITDRILPLNETLTCAAKIVREYQKRISRKKWWSPA